MKGGSRGGGLQVPLSTGQVLLLAKNVLLFAELSFCFPELSFCFPEIPFYFLELPFYFPKVSFCFTEMPFYFSKIPHCFPELTLRIVKNCLLFVSCVHLFFSPRWFNFLFVVLRAAQREISLAIALFPLESPTYDVFLITLKPFYVFYSNFSLHYSLKNAVFEHLQWLNFQKFSGGFAPKPPRGGLQHSTQKRSRCIADCLLQCRKLKV